MGALKRGISIHVVTKNRYFAERFMSENFNEPDRIIKGQNEFTYLYENGDEVRWLYPRESCRANRCHFLYYDDTVSAELLSHVFYPARLPVEIYIESTR